MAEAMAEVRTPPSWMYVNDFRVLSMILGAAWIVLGLGMLLFQAYGAEHEDAVDVFLGTGIFLLLFCLLLFLPRLRSRGPRSFSLLVERPMDDVAEAVTSAVAETGRAVRVEIHRSRSARPPRTLFVDGVPWTFSLRAAPYRERKGDGTSWTELVQSGFEKLEDEVARDLRERVLVRLATSDSSSS